jgi:hypothetical protein
MEILSEARLQLLKVANEANDKMGSWRRCLALLGPPLFDAFVLKHEPPPTRNKPMNAASWHLNADPFVPSGWLRLAR